MNIAASHTYFLALSASVPSGFSNLTLQACPGLFLVTNILPVTLLSCLQLYPLHPLWYSTLGITESTLMKATKEFLQSATVSESPKTSNNLKLSSPGFPGGAVVESLPANAGDTGSGPGLGGSHMPRST